MIAIVSRPSISDEDFPRWWAQRKVKARQHDRDPVTDVCMACGMTRVEQLDYEAIECADAAAADLPQVDWFGIAGTELAQYQRILMIEGLWSIAERLDVRTGAFTPTLAAS